MGKLVTENYQIASEKLPEEFDGVKIAYLSDLHNVSLGQDNQELLDKIAKEQPDYVFSGGDMIVGRRSFEREAALSLLKRLSERYPVYMGFGNHEQKLMKYKETKDSLFPEYVQQVKEMGIILLDNDNISIGRGAGQIRLYGLTMDYKYYGKWWKPAKMKPEYIRELLGDKRGEEFSILLAHTPKYFETYAAWGVDLVLSGHIHGGIMILPGLGGVIAPDYVLFPKYDFGYFKEGKSQMVLSRGLGAHTIKLRIFNKPELSIITLKRTC